jgi:hypothetical protein
VPADCEVLLRLANSLAQAARETMTMSVERMADETRCPDGWSPKQGSDSLHVRSARAPGARTMAETESWTEF